MATREPSSRGRNSPPALLTLRGTDFELVSVRRSGVAVYRGNATYLRIGAGLEPELAVHRLMLDHGYPVPRILQAGRHDGAPYAVEESLGSLTLGDRFEREQEGDGRISDEGFSVFVDVAERFARAQAACASAAGKRGDGVSALLQQGG